MREDPRHAIALVTVRWIFIHIVMLILFGFVALLLSAWVGVPHALAAGAATLFILVLSAIARRACVKKMEEKA